MAVQWLSWWLKRAEVTFKAGVVAVEYYGKGRRLDDDEGLEDEDILVEGKIVPLEVLEQRGAEVVEVESSTVVPRVSRAIQEMREREMVQGAPTSRRGSGGTGVGMRPSGWRGLNGHGMRSGNGGFQNRVTYPFGYGDVGEGRGYGDRGRGRGWGRWG